MVVSTLYVPSVWNFMIKLRNRVLSELEASLSALIENYSMAEVRVGNLGDINNTSVYVCRKVSNLNQWCSTNTFEGLVKMCKVILSFIWIVFADCANFVFRRSRSSQKSS